MLKVLCIVKTEEKLWWSKFWEIYSQCTRKIFYGIHLKISCCTLQTLYKNVITVAHRDCLDPSLNRKKWEKKCLENLCKSFVQFFRVPWEEFHFIECSQIFVPFVWNPRIESKLYSTKGFGRAPTSFFVSLKSHVDFFRF